MDLPTYTSIWRIEKRLYKLYDFRLPMPVPVGQIAVFAAITVPYVILLTILGLPFNHTLFWLYVLPPGVITWLATRPVLESKRLPELIISQVRYLGEPGTWARMAPLAEKDDVVVIGKVWRRDEERSRAPAEAPALAPAAARRPDPARVRQAARRARRAAGRRWTARPGHRGRPAGPGAECRSGAAPAPQGPARPSCSVAGDRGWPRGAVVRRGGGHGAGRDRPRRAAGPAPPGGRASGPPCRPARVPGRCAGDGRQERGRHHPAGAYRGGARGPPGCRIMAGQGPAHPCLAGERDDAGRASLDPAGSASPGPSGLRGSGDPRGTRGTRGTRRSASRPGRGRPGPGGGRPGPGGRRPCPLRTRFPGGESGCAGRARHGHARRARSERAGAGGSVRAVGGQVSRAGRVLHRRGPPRGGRARARAARASRGWHGSERARRGSSCAGGARHGRARSGRPRSRPSGPARRCGGRAG